MTRIFLGWDKPILNSAAELFAARGQEPGLSLSRFTTVVPGQRAGRALLAKLTEIAEEQGTALLPPRIVTPGMLPELFYSGFGAPLSELEAEFLWVRILKEEQDLLAAAFSERCREGSFNHLHGVALTLSRLRSELGALGEELPKIVADLLDQYVVAHERWEAIRSLMERFDAELERMQRADTHLARARAKQAGSLRPVDGVILLGTLDLPPVARDFLKLSGSSFEAWIHSPEGNAEGFDDLGCVRADFWRDFDLSIPDEMIDRVNGPADQAKSVIRTIDRWAKEATADDIVVAVPDQPVAPYIREALLRYDLAVRDASGVMFSQTGPGTLLGLTAAFLSTGGMQELGSLIRHPDLMVYLSILPEIRKLGIADLTAVFDRYQTETVSRRLIQAGELVLTGSRSSRVALEHVLVALEALGIESMSDGGTLSSAVATVRKLLLQIYGERTLRRGLDPEKAILQSLEAIDQELQQIESTAPLFAVEINLCDLLALLLKRLGPSAIEPNTFEAAIELTGWLELYFDERRYVIVSGCNEGVLPETLTEDPFLPDHVRSEIGLSDNASRYARDCCVLAALRHSRSDVRLISAHKGANDDVLLPSRLLLTSKANLASRVLYFMQDQVDELDFPPAPKDTNPQRLLPFEPTPLTVPIEQVSVSAISRYLECPYRFYLEHVEGLRELRDDAQELDGPAFGSLGHSVLAVITPESELAICTDPALIDSALQRRLEQLVLERFGRNPAAAVVLQVRQLSIRLRRFAEWQASWVAHGWRIKLVEHPVKGTLQTSAGPLAVRAQVDRMDFHEATGAYAVFDYKFQDQERSAVSMHTRARAGEWIGLQLPLYRMLLKQQGISEPIRLATIPLSGEQGEVAPSWLEFDAATFEEAEAVAQQVGAKIRSGVFWPPSRILPLFDNYRWICGVGVVEEDADVTEEVPA